MKVFLDALTVLLVLRVGLGLAAAAQPAAWEYWWQPPFPLAIHVAVMVAYGLLARALRMPSVGGRALSALCLAIAGCYAPRCIRAAGWPEAIAYPAPEAWIACLTWLVVFYTPQRLPRPLGDLVLALAGASGVFAIGATFGWSWEGLGLPGFLVPSDAWRRAVFPLAAVGILALWWRTRRSEAPTPAATLLLRSFSLLAIAALEVLAEALIPAYAAFVPTTMGRVWILVMASVPIAVLLSARTFQKQTGGHR